MYKVLLADDEPFIREGIRDLLDWNGLGYEVAGVFEDGRPVLKYLQGHAADVVVTDIKMPFGTGLDIAKYVCDNHLHTRIILISGYREVDLAMAAIQYGVCQYILKPVDIQELEAHLTKIKRQLDQERKNRSNQFALEYYQHSIEELKNDFFTELATGSFTNELYLANMFQLLYPRLELEACPCCEITICFPNYAEYLKNHWEHTGSELYRCLQNCILLCSAAVEYRMIHKAEDRVILFGLLVQPHPGEGTEHLIHSQVEGLCRELRETFYIETMQKELKIYRDILEYSHNCSVYCADAPSFLLDFHEQEKLLLSNLGAGNPEKTRVILEHLLTYLRRMDFPVAKELACEMLTVFGTKLREGGSRTAADLLERKGSQRIQQTEDFPAMERALQEIFQELEACEEQDGQREDELIRNVKAYIVGHITEDISLESISEKFYLSQYYFSRIFKRKTGSNLIDYIVGQKMEKAKQLLENPRIKVYEISQMVGYQSNRYFTKVFKAHTGYTPTEYRVRYYRQGS